MIADLGTMNRYVSARGRRSPPCDRSRGYELSSVHEGIALIDAAWSEPGPLGCATLVCL